MAVSEPPTHMTALIHATILVWKFGYLPTQAMSIATGRSKPLSPRRTPGDCSHLGLGTWYERVFRRTFPEFDRQVQLRWDGVRPLLIDFYSSDLKVAVELDGPSHRGWRTKIRDYHVDSGLAALGIVVWHIENALIENCVQRNLWLWLSRNPLPNSLYGIPQDEIARCDFLRDLICSKDKAPPVLMRAKEWRPVIMQYGGSA